MYGSRRSRTPVSRATSRAAISISARRNTWRRMRGASSPRACGWSAAAAGRRRSISGRSRWRRSRWGRGWRGTRRARREARSPVASQPNAQPAVARESKSALARKLVNGGFIRAIELVPPRGHAPPRALERRGAAGEARRRRRDDSRRPALRRAHERAVDGRARAAACGSGSAAAVFVSRSQPAGHPVGSAGRARDGRAQPARHHRRCAQASATSRMPRLCSTSIRSG